MKLIRHLTAAGPAYAALQPDGSGRIITGDPLGTFSVTDQVITPGRLLAPLVPVNILGIGLNYRRHAEEGNKAVPTRPMWFMKNTAAVQDPGGPIELPRTVPSQKVDFEGELAVVIGRRCRNATPVNALSHVLGYTIANDVSARDWQFELGGGQFCHGKSYDTFCPLGPVLVTPDELANPQALHLVTRLNGQVMQEATTADMVFDVATLITFLSGSRTLLPGTVILTGTPHGIGYARQPPVWLLPGHTVSVEIERIGTLTNPVTEEMP